MLVKLPKTLRVAVDSRPLEGAGRVEDTVNLLAHAARKIVACVAELLKRTEEHVARAAGIPFGAREQREEGARYRVERSGGEGGGDRAAGEADRFSRRVGPEKVPAEMTKPPLREHLATLAQIRRQDLEPDPTTGGKRRRIREGVAEDRRVIYRRSPDASTEERARATGSTATSSTSLTDLDTGLIVACMVAPANQPEEESAPILKAEVERLERKLREWHCDRGYTSPAR